MQGCALRAQLQGFDKWSTEPSDWDLVWSSLAREKALDLANYKMGEQVEDE